MDKKDLEKQLKLDELHVNMLVYRYRQQLKKQLDNSDVINQLLQRRKGELRFACEHVTIVGGAEL